MDNTPTAQNETQSRSASVYSQIIPANGTYSCSQYGDRFYFVKATAGIFVKSDKTVEKPYGKGKGEQFTNDFRFSRLEVRNPNAYPVYIQIWVGFGAYLDASVELIENFTEISGYTSRLIAPTTTLVFPGNPAGTQLQRKAFIISNEDPSGKLYILDANDNYCVTVFPGFSITLPISGTVKVRNESGLSVPLAISEIFYVYA